MGQISDKLSTIMSTEQEERVPFDENGDNGLVLFNKYIPEELMIELFLHYFDLKTLLSCHLVCKRWNSLIQNYIWRKKAEIVLHHSLPVDKNAPWTMYYLICHKKIFHRNLIKNHSGEKGATSNWSQGIDWKVENPPIGVPPLPEDPLFQNSNHCFVTTFHQLWKEQTIDLIKEGFSEWILDNIQPTIKVSEYYSCRWDCPAVYENKIILLNETNKPFYHKRFVKQMVGKDQNVWFKFEHEINNYGKGLRKIAYWHGGKDSSYWAGQYGSKMARACITFEFPQLVNGEVSVSNAEPTLENYPILSSSSDASSSENNYEDDIYDDDDEDEI